MQRSEILDLLNALAARLETRGLRGEMYVVGGAAIALAFDERRSTRDIDAVLEPKRAIYDAAEEILAVATDTYGELLDPAARFFVEELFP